LADKLCGCEIYYPEQNLIKRPSKLFSQELEYRGARSTVGNVLRAEKNSASKYPNEIRYGDNLVHYPPQAMLLCSKKVLNYAKRSIKRIKKI